MFPIPTPCFIISPMINLDGEGWFVLRCFAYTIESRLLTEQKHIQARSSVFDLPRSFERMIAAPPVRRPSQRIHPIEGRQDLSSGLTSVRLCVSVRRHHGVYSRCWLPDAERFPV